MKKLSMTAIVACVAVLSAFAAGSQDAAVPAPAKDQIEDVVIKIWTAFASPLTRPHFDATVAEFSQASGLKAEHVPVSEGWMEKFRTAVAAKTAPDVVFQNITSLYDPSGKSRAEIEKEAPFVYLDTLVDASKLKGWVDDFYPDGWLKNQAFFGGYFALPYEMAAEVLFYNKDLYAKAGYNPDKPPATMDEFHEAVRKISENGKKEGKEEWGYLFEAKSANDCAFLLNFAGPLNDSVVPFGYKNKQGEYVFTLATERNAKALENFYKKPVASGWTGPVTGYDYMTARSAFGDGKVGFFRIGSYMMLVYNRQYSALKYGMAELPASVSGAGYVDSGTTNYFLITKKELGGHPANAARFVEYMASPAGQVKMMVEAGKLVSNKKTYQMSGIPDYILQAKAILDKRIGAQQAFTAKQIAKYPDMDVLKSGALTVPSASLPTALSGGRIVNTAGELFQKYMLGLIEAKDYLVTLEQEWSQVFEREKIPYVKSSLGWKSDK